jgi:hypothetical protein
VKQRLRSGLSKLIFPALAAGGVIESGGSQLRQRESQRPLARQVRNWAMAWAL